MKKYKDFFYSNVSYTDKDERLFAKETLLFDVTEDLLLFLEDHDISKKELAKRLGKTAAYVTQMLNGSRNMTLGSLSDICFALGFKPEVSIPSLEIQKVENQCPIDWEILTKAVHIPSKTHIAQKKTKTNNVLTPKIPSWEKKAA